MSEPGTTIDANGPESAKVALRRWIETPDTAGPDGGDRAYGFWGRLAYRASFGLGYGVVYPFASLARLVPGENAAVYGLVDGATAARDEASGLGRTAESFQTEPAMTDRPA